jgi:formylglycine-generating enzyme required for sulfatase activity
MGAYEVTQGQFLKVMGTNPSNLSATGGGKARAAGLDTTDFPVESVTWDEANEFCAKLSAAPAEKTAGRSYRLPTEAEWEYACRAGTTAPYHFGATASSRQANFNGTSYGGADRGPNLGRTCKVGSYAPNAWGLFDMHGNVYEWVADHFDVEYYKKSPVKDPKGPERGDQRVLRSGSWDITARDCRSAERSNLPPTARNYSVGFRVVCVPGRAP